MPLRFSVMVRLGLIIFAGGAIAALIGCGRPQHARPVYEQAKIYELAPYYSKSAHNQSHLLVELDTHIFEVPAANLSLLADGWGSLSKSSLTFTDAKAFKANGFAVAMGKYRMWNTLANSLRSANGRKLKTVTLLLFDAHLDYVPLATMRAEKTIFYTTADGRMVGATLQNGITALRIRNQRVPGTRGVCKVSIQPVFRSAIPGKTKQLTGGIKYSDIVFDSVGFELKMSPGEFVFLGPGDYRLGQMTLSGLFFSHLQPKPVLRMYLIVCRGISD